MDPITLALIGGGMQALGGIFGGISSSKTATADRREQARQFNITQGMNQQQIANQSTQLDPLAQQKKRAQFALLASLLPGFSNFSMQAPAGMGKYMPQMSGGFSLPAGGISPEVLKYFSPASAASAEQNFASTVNPNAGNNAALLASVGYPGMNGPSPGMASTPYDSIMATQTQRGY